MTGPDNYSAVAPPVEAEDDGVVPPLVLRARQMGLDVSIRSFCNTERCRRPDRAAVRFRRPGGGMGGSARVRYAILL